MIPIYDPKGQPKLAPVGSIWHRGRAKQIKLLHSPREVFMCWDNKFQVIGEEVVNGQKGCFFLTSQDEEIISQLCCGHDPLFISTRYMIQTHPEVRRVEVYKLRAPEQALRSSE